MNSFKPFPLFFSLGGRAEAGGAFPYKQTGADSSGVPGAGCLGDGTLPPREQGHAALPQAGAAGLDWDGDVWHSSGFIKNISSVCVCVCVCVYEGKLIRTLNQNWPCVCVYACERPVYKLWCLKRITLVLFISLSVVTRVTHCIWRITSLHLLACVSLECLFKRLYLWRFDVDPVMSSMLEMFNEHVNCAFILVSRDTFSGTS